MTLADAVYSSLPGRLIFLGRLPLWRFRVRNDVRVEGTEETGLGSWDGRDIFPHQRYHTFGVDKVFGLKSKQWILFNNKEEKVFLQLFFSNSFDISGQVVVVQLLKTHEVLL